MEDPETDVPILFSSDLCVGQSLTKAGPAVVENGNFCVYGSWQKDDATSPIEVFSAVNVNYEGGSYLYTPLRYWRSGGTYHFCAVYPQDATCEYGTGAQRLVVKYSMHSDDYDLMAAKASASASSHPDKVNLSFGHACAAVRFLFRNGIYDVEEIGAGVVIPEEEKTKYKLNSFELRNLQTTGVFIYDSEDIVIGDWYPAEARAESVFSWKASASSPAFLIPDSYEDYEKDHSEWHYVIPQTLKPYGSVEPSVRFSVLINDNPTPVYTTLSLVKNPNIVWQPGYVYTYQIRIQRSKVEVTMEVEPWDSYKVAVEDIVFN